MHRLLKVSVFLLCFFGLAISACASQANELSSGQAASSGTVAALADVLAAPELELAFEAESRFIAVDSSGERLFSGDERNPWVVFLAQRWQERDGSSHLDLTKSRCKAMAFR